MYQAYRKFDMESYSATSKKLRKTQSRMYYNVSLFNSYRYV